MTKRLYMRKALAGALLIISAAAFPAGASDGVSLTRTLEPPPLAAGPSSWGRDPFVPLVTDAEGPALALKAIFYNETRPSAIINAEIVYVGSRIDGQKVVDIGRTHVILHGEYGRVRLELAGLPEFTDGGR